MAESGVITNCVQCGKPKKQTRARRGASLGSRMDRRLWLYELERDPYCSRKCCEAAHGINSDPEHPVRECKLVSCSKPFEARTGLHFFCSKRCADNYKKLRKYNIPGRCSGCGGDYLEVTRGCAHCWDRERRRVRRQDPAQREWEQVRDKAARKRRRERQKVAA